MIKFLTRFLLFVFKIGATFFIVHYLYNQFDWIGVGNLLPRLDKNWMAIATFFMIAKLLIETFKWLVVNRAFDLQLSYLKLLRYKVSGSAFDFLVPVPQGEDVYKFIVLKHAAAGMDASVSIPFLMRVTGLVGCALLLPFTLFFYGSQLGPTQQWWLSRGLAIGWGGIIILGIWIAICWVMRSSWWPNSLTSVFGANLLKSITRVAKVIWANRMVMMWTIPLSLGVHITYCTMVFALTRAVGVEQSFTGVVAALPLIYFAAVLPLTPGGIGLKEGVIIWMLSLNSCGVTGAHAVSLLHLSLNIAVVVVGFGLLIFERFNFSPKTK